MYVYFFSETTALLLLYNSPVKVKNSEGWNCLQEAISYGDRQISKFVLIFTKLMLSYHISFLFIFFI